MDSNFHVTESSLRIVDAVENGNAKYTGGHLVHLKKVLGFE